MIAAAQRLFAGRDGRIALTLVLAVTAALEASLYTPDTYGEFPSRSSGDPGLAIFLNVLAVLPFVAASRFPLLAAAAFDFLTLSCSRPRGARHAHGARRPRLHDRPPRRPARAALRGAAPRPFLVHAMAPSTAATRARRASVPLLFVAVVLVAESSRKRTEAVAALDATQEAMAESVREQTAMEERARIARELHDIVAHHLSVIAVQSETARLLPRSSPPMRAGASRRSHRRHATRSPRPSAARSSARGRRRRGRARAAAGPRPARRLIDTARDAGADVRLILQGKVVPLPAGVDLAAYRIVQEALTNARRHAPGANVDVEVTYDGLAAISASGTTARGRQTAS